MINQMNKMLKFTAHHTGLLSISLLLLSLFNATPAFSTTEQQRNYTFTTATTAGTYYPVGVAIATLTKIKLEPKYNISLSAMSSAGSGENIKLLANNEAQFAILQGLYGAWAWNGSGALKHLGPQQHLRSISMLWQNVEHFIIKSDLVREGDLSDFRMVKQKRFSIGQKNSGTEGSGRHILESLGFNPDLDFQLVNLGYGASADALIDQKIVGINIPAGPPVGAVTRAFAALGKDITVLHCNELQLARINTGYNLWNSYRIPAGTYPGQDKEIRTIAQPNIMVVRDNVDEDAVYKIIKTIYENLDFLQNIHQATRHMSLERAIIALPLPLHPGAARFYREQGIEIPDHLIQP